MIKKVLGGLIIAGVVFGAAFAIKFLPIYLGVNELERAFNECMSNYDTWGNKGCRDLFTAKIEKNDLSLDPSHIEINCRVHRDSRISAEWEEPIDFWGIWTYYYQPSIQHTGKPPKRD